MRDILDVLTSRKSIRRYKPDPVPEEMIDKILEAARWAPTGENYQPWRFIVIRDQETRNQIGDLSKLGSGKRMTAWYCMGTMQKRFEKIQDPVKRAEVLRFMYSGEVSAVVSSGEDIRAALNPLVALRERWLWGAPFKSCYGIGQASCSSGSRAICIKLTEQARQAYQVDHGGRLPQAYHLLQSKCLEQD